MSITIYQNVTVKVGDNGTEIQPIEGSVSMSLDEGSNEVTKLKYEGGSTAAIKVAIDTSPSLTLEWKIPGKPTTTASTTDDTKVTISSYATSSSKTPIASVELTGIYIESVTWDSQWGFVTQCKLIQKPTISDGGDQ